MLERYLEHDEITAVLDRSGQASDEGLTCQRWLRETPAKRMILSILYGELLTSDRPLRIADVGGGLTTVSRLLANRHNYTLIDLLAHDDRAAALAMMRETSRDFLVQDDWFKAALPDTFDLAIANDIFPNTDQRLELFLKRFLPIARRIRMSLTYYDDPRSYLTRRLDGEEIMCMLAWDGRHLRSVLERYRERIVVPDFEIFERQGASVFPNGRQVCLVEMRGDLV
jgi:hypothetical protein